MRAKRRKKDKTLKTTNGKTLTLEEFRKITRETLSNLNVWKRTFLDVGNKEIWFCTTKDKRKLTRKFRLSTSDRSTNIKTFGQVKPKTIKSLFNLLHEGKLSRNIMGSTLGAYYAGENPEILKRGNEKMRVDEEVEDGTSFNSQVYELCGHLVPLEVVLEILSYIRHDAAFLFNMGSVNSSWYLLILRNWNGRLIIRRHNLLEHSVLVLRNAKIVTIDPPSSGKLSIGAVEYLLKNLNDHCLREFYVNRQEKQVLNVLKKTGLKFPRCHVVGGGSWIPELSEFFPCVRSLVNSWSGKDKGYPDIESIYYSIASETDRFTNMPTTMKSFGRMTRELKNVKKLSSAKIYGVETMFNKSHNQFFEIMRLPCFDQLEDLTLNICLWHLGSKGVEKRGSIEQIDLRNQKRLKRLCVRFSEGNFYGSTSMIDISYPIKTSYKRESTTNRGNTNSQPSLYEVLRFDFDVVPIDSVEELCFEKMFLPHNLSETIFSRWRMRNGWKNLKKVVFKYGPKMMTNLLHPYPILKFLNTLLQFYDEDEQEQEKSKIDPLSLQIEKYEIYVEDLGTDPDRSWDRRRRGDEPQDFHFRAVARGLATWEGLGPVPSRFVCKYNRKYGRLTYELLCLEGGYYQRIFQKPLQWEHSIDFQQKSGDNKNKKLRTRVMFAEVVWEYFLYASYGGVEKIPEDSYVQHLFSQEKSKTEEEEKKVFISEDEEDTFFSIEQGEQQEKNKKKKKKKESFFVNEIILKSSVCFEDVFENWWKKDLDTQRFEMETRKGNDQPRNYTYNDYSFVHVQYSSSARQLKRRPTQVIVRRYYRKKEGEKFSPSKTVAIRGWKKLDKLKKRSKWFQDMKFASSRPKKLKDSLAAGTDRSGRYYRHHREDVGVVDGKSVFELRYKEWIPKNVKRLRDRVLAKQERRKGKQKRFEKKQDRYRRGRTHQKLYHKVRIWGDTLLMSKDEYEDYENLKHGPPILTKRRPRS